MALRRFGAVLESCAVSCEMGQEQWRLVASWRRRRSGPFVSRASYAPSKEKRGHFID